MENGDDKNTGTLREQSTPPSSSIESVVIRLPQFWVNSPETWFAQAEAQFLIGRINKDILKYNHVLTSLPQTALESVLDFIQNPPASNIYEQFKNTLIERHSLSEERRIEKLLSSEEIGDRKPSEYLRSLKQLAGASGSISNTFIKKLWLRRLPQIISIALIPQQDKEESEIVSLADKIWEAATPIRGLPSVSTIGDNTMVDRNSRTQPNSQNELLREIKHLKTMMKSLSVTRNKYKQRAFRNPRRSRSNSRDGNSQIQRYPNNHCWYHRKYKAHARKCQQPCNYKRESLHQRDDESKNQ